MKPVFIVDTNVVIDYPDIIPNGKDTLPDEPTVDTSHAHIVMPDVVVREMAKFKGERSDRGKVARKVSRCVRALIEGGRRDPRKVYELSAPIERASDGREFSVLPLSKDFAREVEWFKPYDNDMDDQIILTALQAQKSVGVDCVTLLTNDNGMAIIAAANGIKTSRYGYRYPAPYTGRRDNVAVPFELYHVWRKNSEITLAEWEEAMPKESPLIANEFVIMTPLEWYENIRPLENIGRYDARRRIIVPLQFANNFPGDLRYDGHACYAEALYNPDIKIVVASGVAGTGKTFMATVCGLEETKAGNYFGITAVIRTQKDDGVGYLPGELSAKLDPNARPIKIALRNYFIQTDKDIERAIKKRRRKKYGDGSDSGDEKPVERSISKQLEDKVALTWENWFDGVAVPHAEGRDFAYEYVIVDEPQDITGKNADMILKRFGRHGKMVLAGDVLQIHSQYSDEYNNGLTYASRLLKGDEEVAHIILYPEEVMRDDLVMRIAQRQRAAREAARNSGE